MKINSFRQTVKFSPYQPNTQSSKYSFWKPAELINWILRARVPNKQRIIMSDSLTIVIFLYKPY